LRLDRARSFAVAGTARSASLARMSAPSRPGRTLLIAAGLLSAGPAVLHLAIIAGGPAWYRAFGAGERMARMAEYGSSRPAVIAVCIAGVLAVWAAYAFSGAGLLRRLPLLRAGLVAISAIYLLRAGAPLLLLASRPN
jgi:hypothetical protein